MKLSSLTFLLLGGVLFLTAPSPSRADDNSTSSAADPTVGQSGTPSAEQREKMKEAFAQLDLTDAQKLQIKQIRASVTDRKERREQVMAVLTPEQKNKLETMIMEHHNAAASSSAPASAAN